MGLKASFVESIVILLTLREDSNSSWSDGGRRIRKRVQSGDALESPETTTRVQAGYAVESMDAVVAADDARCSEIGASVLRSGGHAVDAAVAVALCLGVVNPMASGVGGGGFMIVRSAATSQSQAIDFRETAPLAASENMYENDLDAKYTGALSMGVPGEIAGLYKAWSRYGRLPWKTLFDPAIRFAKDGFMVAPYLAGKISSNADKIKNDPGLRQVFAPNGEVLESGDICYNPKLGWTLEVVANEGPKAFYDGVVGEKLVNDVQDAGGILTMEDLRNYNVEVMDALAVDTMGYTVLGMPAPSSGTLGLALKNLVLYSLDLMEPAFGCGMKVSNILESYESSNAAKGSLGLHRFIEALKHMYAFRMDLGDPDFVNISKTMADMLSPKFAKSIRERIYDNTTFPPAYYMPRNAVSMTTTVNYAFGGGVLSPSTGIVLNNEMGDFSVPTEDEQLAGVIGGSGGMSIIPAVAQFLEERGHELKAKAGGAICQLIVQTLNKKPNENRKPMYNQTQVLIGMLTAVSDPRKDGRPAAC
ncbi:Gamma-glutamyltranspeptidase [Cynara cardunculus var. scolymus]|uniref:Gamma-glutamyltranspeptidase n=1 Tax=Cynara cardunculus var. scolymus TaxID=59895 RepID=A0A103XN35_CYNCS|nr:Gamma-glutamyltranspeptidase [Cynara cardunculus var. scolymus]